MRLALFLACLCVSGCQTLDIIIRITDVAVKVTDLAITASGRSRPTTTAPAPPLPRKHGWPYIVLQRLEPGHLAADRCRVRVEPLVFNPESVWDGKAREEYFGGLPEVAQQEMARGQALAKKTFEARVESGDYGLVGRRGKVTLKPGQEAFVTRSSVRAVNTTSGLLLGHFEIVATSDGAKVGEFVIYGASTEGGRDWMGASAKNLGLGVLTFLGDHFGCKSPPRARYVPAPAAPANPSTPAAPAAAPQ